MSELSIRKLTAELTKEKAEAVHRLLLSQHIEVYAREESSEKNMENEKQDRAEKMLRGVPETSRNAEKGHNTDVRETEDFFYAGENRELSGGSVYVPAADYQQARKLLEEGGYAEFLLQDQPESQAGERSEIDQITQDYYKKRRMHLIEWGVILLVVFVYSLVRNLLQ